MRRVLYQNVWITMLNTRRTVLVFFYSCRLLNQKSRWRVSLILDWRNRVLKNQALNGRAFGYLFAWKQTSLQRFSPVLPSSSSCDVSIPHMEALSIEVIHIHLFLLQSPRFYLHTIRVSSCIFRQTKSVTPWHRTPADSCKHEQNVLSTTALVNAFTECKALRGY